MTRRTWRWARAASAAAALAWVGASAPGCWPIDRLDGKACDYEHPCFSGYRCLRGVCVDEATIPPPLPGTDAGIPADDDGGVPDAG